VGLGTGGRRKSGNRNAPIFSGGKISGIHPANMTWLFLTSSLRAVANDPTDYAPSISREPNGLGHRVSNGSVIDFALKKMK
jgi:hypothetical protein